MQSKEFPNLQEFNSALKDAQKPLVAQKYAVEKTALQEVPEDTTDEQKIRLRWPDVDYERAVLQRYTGSPIEWSTLGKKLDKIRLKWQLKPTTQAHFAFSLGKGMSLEESNPLKVVAISPTYAVVFIQNSKDAVGGFFFACNVTRIQPQRNPVWQRINQRVEHYRLGTVGFAHLFYLDNSTFFVYNIERRAIDKTFPLTGEMLSSIGATSTEHLFSINLAPSETAVGLLASGGALIFGLTETGFDYLGPIKAEGTDSFTTISCGPEFILVSTSRATVQRWIRYQDEFVLEVDRDYLLDGNAKNTNEPLKFNPDKAIVGLAHRGSTRMIIGTKYENLFLDGLHGRTFLGNARGFSGLRYFGDMVALLTVQGQLIVAGHAIGNIIANNATCVSEVYASLLPSNNQLCVIVGSAAFALLPDGYIVAIFT